MSKTETQLLLEKQEQLIQKAATFVKDRFIKGLAPKYLFHNFTYAKEVAGKAGALAKAAGLSEADQAQLVIAGYFYPLGYVGGHKEFAGRSAAMFEDWARNEKIELVTKAGNAASWIKKVAEATKEDELPVRLLHDAVWSWLGRKRYERRAGLLQLEREAIKGKVGDPVEFGKEMQAFLLNFQYLSTVGKEEFDIRRRKNVGNQQSANYKVAEKEVKAKTGKNFGRGIDTMYRTAFRNHINLSRIADGKANMMISINTIILSIVITISGASLSFFEEVFFENPEFLIPIISLLLTSLTAVVFAVFSARPSVTEYRIKKDKLVKSN